jgi:predicted Zn-dependent peptidase
MTDEIWQLPDRGIRVIVVHRPRSFTTSAVVTYARGFGDDPGHAPGVAHLHEHLFLATLRSEVAGPLVAQARTYAEATRVSATVRAGAEHHLVRSLTATSGILAAAPVDDAVRLRECRAIDVELAEWSRSPLLAAGHRLAALANQQSWLGRFDECQVGDSECFAPADLLTHARHRRMMHPRQVVVAGPRPPQEWQQLLAGRELTDSAANSDPKPAAGGQIGLTAPEGRVFVGIPLPPSDSETAYLAAQVMLRELGPLADVGHTAGARFRGGSVIPTNSGTVVVASWLTTDARQREAIGLAVSQSSGCAGPELIATEASALPRLRAAAAANTASLATAVDDWQSGYGVDPTSAGAPGSESINDLLHAGWRRAVLVGANLGQQCPQPA